MSDRTKELILKTLLVIGITLLLLLFPGGIFLSFLVPSVIPDQKSFEFILYTIFFSMVGAGALFMILLPIFGGLKQKPVKADKVPLLFASHDKLFDFLQERLLQKGYQLQKEVSIPCDGKVTLYAKPRKWRALDCFTIVRASELSEELIESANVGVTSILTEYYECDTITDTVCMISVFCVDRVTPVFQKLVNGAVQQEYKIGRLPVGISYGGRNIYIAKPKDGFAHSTYKWMRKEFVDIMNLANQNTGGRFSCNTGNTGGRFSCVDTNTGDGSVC